MHRTFEDAFDKYAEMAIKVSVNLQPGQRLIINSPIECVNLVRALSKHAYDQGCRLVHVLWSDEELRRIRHEHAPRDSFEEYADWQRVAWSDTVAGGDALISFNALNPDLLNDQDPELVALEEKTRYARLAEVYDRLGKNAVNWLVLGPPIPSWANKIFPDLPEEERLPRLWEEVFKVSRIYEDDPVASWQAHLDDLERRRAYLNARNFSALHFKSPQTDLEVGLPKGHIWFGGSTVSENGICFVPNMPTEEVFTLPHREQVNGKVHSTRPFTYAGTMIDDFELTLRNGEVVACKASQGEAMLNKLLETDEGARRLGEVALVPNSSPISQSGFRFKNTLYDENAASHLAFGRAYKFTIVDGSGMDTEAFNAAGGNYSLVHEDFMIGDGEIDLDGVRPDGQVEGLMRAGEWSFEV